MTLQPAPLRSVLAAALLTTLAPSAGSAQSPLAVNGYVVSSARAIEAARTVLRKQGYEIVRIDRTSNSWTVFYRRRGESTDSRPPRLAVLTITRLGDRIHFLAAPEIVIDIEIELAWPPKLVAGRQDPHSRRALAH